MLVAVEGLDGSGKRTLTAAVVERLRADGLRVATLAFPRYGESVHADLAAEALHGRHGDLAGSVHAMAVLFALDRAGARDRLAELAATYDVVLLDRYVASNAAYSAARLHQDGAGEVVGWVAELEFGRLQLPRPDVHLLLAVPVELAGERARGRERREARTLDAYERDTGLQARTDAVYRNLAARNWYGTWWTAGPGDDPAALAARLGGVASRTIDRG
ncbi:dTMP kinase [Skermania piniformis]|uniref:Thymidylate kinase n=1 Tax=Skermania pinensis TaxID=39122 RepID=A0ABX8S8D2_9ACTN|nr:dTMP kinase [Skermania piniformis]QXQ13264.1 dTMP kinase [Skermania piniformis]